ncbi:hypothetical protein G7Y89_g10599 [Cudoniella acicularis]|uniref:FAD-binding PCMH-type domain-containing protein n=1 Tax=Cudoniella acicularis TaxID=354080 RepID=A0A8H4W1G2_9HELO|nr:hypothetical protein G7Y89_g10599 [Cudoniella acicularis]
MTDILKSGLRRVRDFWCSPKVISPKDSVVRSASSNLTQTLGHDKVALRGTIKYAESLNSYYSAQERHISPICVVQPSTAEDVSKFITEIAALNTEGKPTVSFAIRAGGHMIQGGAANIENGITLDLSKMNSVTVAEEVISIEPGARWGNVYKTLSALGLSTPGGRVADVGVGGYLIGGGISFFSPRKGFGCDSILNFEVVLANGTLVSANKDENHDLFLALKGGSNNFGVVVRFDIQGFSQGDFLGGSLICPFSTLPDHITAISDLTASPNYDPYASVMVTLSWDRLLGFLIQDSLVHTSGTSTKEDPPPSLQPFLDIEHSISTMRHGSVADFGTELKIASDIFEGKESLYATVTVKNDREFLASISASWKTMVETLALEPSLLLANMVFEPLPTVITSKSAGLGGNSLGLQEEKDNLVVILFIYSWASEHDSTGTIAAAEKFVRDVDNEAKEKGFGSKFTYLNYASAWQDPIDGLGEEMKSRLRKASEKYDPQGMFQKAVPGGFKLFA